MKDMKKLVFTLILSELLVASTVVAQEHQGMPMEEGKADRPHAGMAMPEPMEEAIPARSSGCRLALQQLQSGVKEVVCTCF